MGCGSSAHVEDPRGFDGVSVEQSLFKDPEFPTTPKSLYYSEEKRDDAKNVVWKRPKELSAQPHLLRDGVSGCDVAQGGLGDCWFLSSCAAIARDKSLMSHVMRDEVDLASPDYDGKLTFHFWRWGKWKPVTIDDRLPTDVARDSTDGKRALIFSRCEDPDEFWLPLVEKAYAKLHGSFEALEGGQEMDGMVDLTGGLAEWYSVDAMKAMDADERKVLFKQLNKAFKLGAFLTCGRVGRTLIDQYKTGLISGHAYTMTNVAYVQTIADEDGVPPYRLVRIKNPWANEWEWNGDWSDKDDTHWNLVGDSVKQRIGYKVKADGEFWMSFDDFLNEFYDLTVCTLTPDLDEDGRTDDPLQTIQFVYGEWKGDTAAGMISYDDSGIPKAGNPQFLLTVSEADDDDEDGECSVVVGLMQMYRRKKMMEFLVIAYSVYRAHKDDPETRLTNEDILENQAEIFVGSAGPSPHREVIGRFELRPGNYVLMPATLMEGQEGEFMFRLYAGKRIQIKQL